MIKPTKLFCIITCFAPGFLLGACSSINSVIPAWNGAPVEHSIAPEGSTEYRCAKGELFFVKLIDNGVSAWLIYPDREVLLTKATGADMRYSNGIAILDIGKDGATLNDGPAIAYTDCKVPVAEKK